MELILYNMIGKKWTLDENWLKISNNKKKLFSKKLFNAINSQYSKLNIDIEHIVFDHYGKDFLVAQLKWFFIKSIINYYNEVKVGKNFEIIKLEKKKYIGWEQPNFSDIDSTEFINKFLYIDCEKIKYDIDTKKEDEIMTLNIKYENLIENLLEKNIDYETILSQSNNYLFELKELEKKNMIIAQQRNK